MILFVVLAFFGFSPRSLPSRTYGLRHAREKPFTGVLREFARVVTQKNANELGTTDYTDVADSVFG